MQAGESVSNKQLSHWNYTRVRKLNRTSHINSGFVEGIGNSGFRVGGSLGGNRAYVSVKLKGLRISTAPRPTILRRLSLPLSMPGQRRNNTRGSGISARPGESRLVNISKFFTRLARHGQRASDGPAIPWNKRREATIEDIIARPSSQALHTTDGDLRQIASDVENHEKKRVYVRFAHPSSSYLVGV